MAMKWSDVAANPAFQALSFDEQEEARNQYFNEVVAPRVPKDEVDAVRGAFLADTQTTLAPPPDTGDETDRLAARYKAPEKPGLIARLSSALPKPVDPLGIASGRPLGATPVRAQEPAKPTKAPTPYRDRREALDDAVNLLEEGADQKAVTEAFSKGGIKFDEIVAHGKKRGSEYFKQQPGMGVADPEVTRLANRFPAPVTGEIKSTRPETPLPGADVLLAGAKGVVGGFKMLMSAGGAGGRPTSTAEKALETADLYLEGLRSAAAVKDDERIGQIMEEAKDGTWADQVVAAAKAAGVAPASLVAQGLGTSVPVILASLLPGVRESTVARLTAQIGLGAAQGAGATKEAIYTAVKDDMLRAGVSKIEAEERAEAAQSYLGQNKDQIAIGMALGALASSTGVERVIPIGQVSKVLAKSGVSRAVASAEQNVIGRGLIGGVTEAVPEFTQGSAEQVAQNVALQREGRDVPTFQGAVGQGTLEALAGFGAGAVTSAAFGRPQTAADQLARELDVSIANTDFTSADPVVRARLDPNTYDPSLVSPAQTARGVADVGPSAPLSFTPVGAPTQEAGLVDIVVPTAPETTDVSTLGATGGQLDLRSPAGSDQLGGGLGLPGLDVDGTRVLAGGDAGLPAADARANVPAGSAAGQPTPGIALPRVAARATDQDLLARTEAAIAAPENNNAVVQPVEQWVGRKGDGYVTEADAAQALPGRQRMFPALEWSVEQMPSGKFRLAGYEQQNTQPAPTVGTTEAGAGTPQPTQAAPIAEPITAPSGKPFSTQQTAAVFAQQNGITGYSTVKMDGGWAIQPMETTLGTQTPQAIQGQTQGQAPAISGAAGAGVLQPLASGSAAQAQGGGDLGVGSVATGPNAQAQRPGALGTPEGAATAGLSAPLRLAPPAPLRAIGKAITTLSASTGVDAEVDTAPLTEQQQAASAVARLLGRTVTYLKADTPASLPNGFMLPGDSKNIFVANDADDAPLSVAMHEIYHTLPEPQRKALNTQLAQYFRQDRRTEFAEEFDYDAKNDALLDEEIPAFMVQAISKRPDFWQDLRTKMGNAEFGEVAKTILAKLNTIISGAKEQYGDEFVSKYITDVAKARDLLSTAYAQAMQEQGLTPDVAVTGDVVMQSRRGTTAAGEFDVRTMKDGTMVVYGDPEQIRAQVPDDVKGRVTKDGIVFTNAAAPRVRAALEGRQVAYSRGGEVTEKLPMKNGKYLGAPEKFNTPGKIPTLRKILRQLADEGAPGRYWYENSGKAVLKMVGGDVQEARKFVALLAIYSPQAKVDANSTFALRAWAQYKAGQPISVKTEVMDTKAKGALDDVDAFWSGEKTGNFFFNLLREIDPSTAGKQGATIDMWMMRAGQYETDAPSNTQYSFMENETNRLARELGWEPQQVQAAIWVAMKARMENKGVKKETERTSEKKGWIKFVPGKDGKGKVRVIIDEQKHRDNWLKYSFAHDVTKDDTQQAKFDFGDGLMRHIGQVSFEARPGRTSGVLPGIHSAPYAQQVEFQQAVQKAFYNERGTDELAAYLGLLVDSDILAPGVWQGEVSPSTQLNVAMAPAKGTEGKTNVDPAQATALNIYAAVAGLVARQEGVGWHRPFYSSTKRDANGLDINVGRTLNPREVADLETAVGDWMVDNGHPEWQDKFAFVSSPNGIRVVNFGIITNEKLQSDIVKVAESVLPDFEYRVFASSGNMPTNNWKESPNGESYVQRIGAEGRSDVLDWARAVLAPRVQQVFDEYADKYGWGDAGQLRFSQRARDGSRGQGTGGAQDRQVQAPERADAQAVRGLSANEALPGAPTVRGFTGPDPRLVAVAEQYARDNGITLRRQAEYAQVDPERAARIAAAYEAMPHAPNDPRVKAAYKELIAQTLAQYRALEKAGYKFWFINLDKPDNVEYASSPWNAMRDIRANKVMGVFPTDDGFGSGDFDPASNPLLEDTGIKWPSGSLFGPRKRVLANDLFRAVHDAFGHGLEGSGFRAQGEENAWQAHVRLFTGSAVAAITSETRGQNSWLNYGPNGESNRTAKVEDTVFADQKTGLLPEFAWTEGRVGDMPMARNRVLEDRSGLSRLSYQGYVKAEVPRVQAARKMAGILAKLDAGTITPQEFELQVRLLSERLAEVSATKDANRIVSERARGADIVREKLIAARRRGEVDSDTTEFALWALQQNPAIAEGLGISVREQPQNQRGAAGDYNPAAEIMRVFKGSANTGTAVHEILHHTERMMPEAVQTGIRKEWSKAYTKALAKADPKQRAALEKMLEAMAGSQAAQDAVRDAFADGTLNYDAHYQLVNPSEFWAVNATDILQRRYEAGSWIGKAKQWLSEMVQTAKGLVGMRSNAPVLRGLEAVLNTDGERQSKKMLSEGEVFEDTTNPDIRRGNRPASMAYHAGDLRYGRDTTLGRMMGGRSTGHFGTGVYFVGDRSKISGREGRPVQSVDLSQYNLAKPRSPGEARRLHDALKAVNEMGDIADVDTRDGEMAVLNLEVVLGTLKDFRSPMKEAVAEAVELRPVYAFENDYIDTAATRLMKKLGYDGVDTRGLDGFDNTEFGTVVYAEQIDLDSAAPAVMRSNRRQKLSTIGQNFDLPATGTVDSARIKLQDDALRMKRVIEAVKAKGGKVGEAQNFYDANTLMPGRIQATMDDFRDNVMRPLIDKAVGFGIDLDELALYAYAKHARERNAYIASINPRMPDGGSGMTNDHADSILQLAKASGDEAKFEELHRDLMAITSTTRQVMLAEGLISQDEFNALDGSYENYIPLRGLENVDEKTGAMRPGVGRGINVRGGETIKALGRKSQASDLIENVIRDYQRVIMRVEKNDVGKVLLDFVLSNPDPDLWGVDVERSKPALNKATGLVQYTKTIEKGEDTIGVKVGGEQVYIKLADPELARAIRQAWKDETSGLERATLAVSGWWNNWLRNVLTRYNPAFAAINIPRDALWSGTSAALAELGPKGLARYLANYGKAFMAASRQEAGLSGSANKFIGNQSVDQVFQEFRNAGAITGGFYMRSLEDINTDLRNEMLLAGAKSKNTFEFIKSLPPYKMATLTARMLEFMGSASENATRFALYQAAKDVGRTPAQAALLAKDGTTNFNRKGEWGGALNNLYLFFNAAVQGTAQLAKVMKSPAVQASMAGVTGIGMMLALYGASSGGEDDDGEAYWDKIPSYVKERNLVFMLPPGEPLMDGIERVGKRGRYFTIPVQYGFNVFPNAGYVMADVFRNSQDPKRGLTPTKAALHMASVFFGSVNPLGGAIDFGDKNSVWLAALPTIADLPYQISENIDSFGRPSSPERASWDTRPDSSRMFTSQINTVPEKIAKALNELGGGNEAKAGKIMGIETSVAPGTIKTLIGSTTGGLGTFIEQVGSSIVAATSDEKDLKAAKVPFLNKFYGEVDEGANIGSASDRMRKVRESVAELEAQYKLGLSPEIGSEEKRMMMLAEANKDYQKAISEMRKDEIEIAKSDMPEAQKKLLNQQIRVQRDKLATVVNRVYLKSLEEQK
jgi:hypothetical protein